MKTRGLTSNICPCGRVGIKIKCNTYVCAECDAIERRVDGNERRWHEGVVGTAEPFTDPVWTAEKEATQCR